MDSNQLEGAVRNTVGKVQDTVGGLLGDTAGQVKGRFNQVAGSAQNAYGQTRGAFDGLLDELSSYAKGQPLIALAAAVSAGLLAGLLIWGRPAARRK